MATTKPLTIGKLARETGIKVVTIRYYEQIGLMPVAPRTDGNYRTYTEAHRRQLRFIRRCRDLGFTIDQIRAAPPLIGEDARLRRSGSHCGTAPSDRGRKTGGSQAAGRRTAAPQRLLSRERNHSRLPHHRSLIAVKHPFRPD